MNQTHGGMAPGTGRRLAQGTAPDAEHAGSAVADTAEKKSLLQHMPSAETLAKGVATGVAVSTITQTGRKVMSVLVRNPLVMFGVGFAAGYFVHKYRKEIIAAASNAAEQSKDFVLRQKESLEDLLAESKDEAGNAG